MWSSRSPASNSKPGSGRCCGGAEPTTRVGLSTWGNCPSIPGRGKRSWRAATLELTRKEFDLLFYLAERVGTVVGKRELLAEVWRQPYGGADKTVDVHLSWVRRKLGESAAEPVYLHTVRGVGVKLAAPTS